MTRLNLRLLTFPVIQKADIRYLPVQYTIYIQKKDFHHRFLIVNL